MFFEPNQEQETGVHEVDVCIIGAGAIGIAMALYLEDKTDLTIAILENGSLSSQESTIKDVVNSGHLSSGLAGSRAYGFGGSTTIWGGQALKFNDLDFANRPWIDHAQWPISNAEIEPYYKVAEEIIGVQDIEFDSNICRSDIAPDDLQAYEQHDIDLDYSKFSSTPNFHNKYLTRIQESKQILCYLDTKTQFDQDKLSKRITSARVKLNKDLTVQLKASEFVIACGGIDSPTTLLTSKLVGLDDLPIGHYYNDHIGIYGAQLIPIDMSKFRALFSIRIEGGVKCLPKLALTEQSQIEHCLANINANIEVETSSKDPLFHMRNLYSQLRNLNFNKETGQTILQLLKHPKALFTACYELVVKRRVYLPEGSTFFLIANIESIPIKESFIKVAGENEDNQKPIAHINWLTSKQSRTTASHFYTCVKKVLEKNNVAKVILKPSIHEDTDAWLSESYGLYHHMGATRMSKSKDHGVVDENCRVHTIPNLFIAGTSVLPTGSASNPTFTAIAVALRLCDHIRSKH